MKNKIILSGNAGSGKTTIGNILSSKTGIPFVSAGDIIRQKMRELNMDILQFQDYCKSHPDIDIEIDKALVEKLSKMNSFIADYRMGFHFFPDAFSVLLQVSDEEAAKRLSSRKKGEENFSTISPSDVMLNIKLRNELMRNRFINIYGKDYLQESNYQMVINTNQEDFTTIATNIFKTLS